MRQFPGHFHVIAWITTEATETNGLC